MTAITVILFFSLLYPVISALGDAYVELEQKVCHPANAVKTVLIAALITALANHNLILFTFWEYVQIFLAFLFIYWNLFDFFYNLFTGRELFYVGKTAVLDKLQRRFFPLFYIKFILLPVSLLILCQFFLR